jgi:hypothetical protein
VLVDDHALDLGAAEVHSRHRSHAVMLSDPAEPVNAHPGVNQG